MRRGLDSSLENDTTGPGESEAKRCAGCHRRTQEAVVPDDMALQDVTESRKTLANGVMYLCTFI